MNVLPDTAAISRPERDRLRQLIAQRDAVLADDLAQPLSDEQLAAELKRIDQLIGQAGDKAATSNRAKGRLRELRQHRQLLIDSEAEARLELHAIRMRAANAEARLIAGCPDDLQQDVANMAELVRLTEDRQQVTADADQARQTHAAWELREAQAMHQAAIRACVAWDPPGE